MILYSCHVLFFNCWLWKLQYHKLMQRLQWLGTLASELHCVACYPTSPIEVSLYSELLCNSICVWTPVSPAASYCNVNCFFKVSISRREIKGRDRRKKRIYVPPPKHDLICWMEPKHTKLPATMMPIRLHSASHSSMLWVVSTTLMFFLITALVIKFHIALLVSGSIPLLGSSRKTTAGSPTCQTKPPPFWSFNTLLPETKCQSLEKVDEKPMQRRYR